MIKPIENQMRPEDSHYKTQKPYMRVVKTKKTKKNLFRKAIQNIIKQKIERFFEKSQKFFIIDT